WGRGGRLSAGATVNLLDPGTGRPTGVALRHSDPVETLWFSADGLAAVSTATSGQGEGRQRGLFNTTSQTWEMHRARDRAWAAATGELLAPRLRQLRGPGNDRRFAPDGARLLTCPRRGEVRLIDLAPDARAAEVLLRVALGLSGRRLTETGELVALERDT